MEKIEYIKLAIFIALVLLIANLLIVISNKILNKAKYIDKTILSFIKPLIKIVVYFLAFMTIANKLGINTSSILAFASILSAAIALSAQNVLSNVFGGLTMLMTKPFKIDDYISTNGLEGSICEIGLFHTKLKTPDNKLIIIPNGSLTNSSIINYSNTGKRRVEIKVGISYDAKIKDVKNSIGKAIKKTENILDEEQLIRVSNYLDSSVEYVVRVWTNTNNYWNVYYDLMENIKEQLDKDKIEIPYTQVVVRKK